MHAQPESSDLQAAYRAFEARDFRQAYDLCLAVLSQQIDSAEAFFLLGLISAEHENWTKAETLFSRAAGLAPDEARFPAHAGRAAAKLKAETRALAYVERAVALGPRDAWTLDTIGVVYSHVGLHERALPFFEEACALAPDNDRFLHNLGVAHQFLGDFPAAETAFRRELRLAPQARRPFAALVTLSKQTPENNFVDELLTQFEAAGGDPFARLQIGHALAKSYEDFGDDKTALNWLFAAKEARAAQIGDLSDHYDKLFSAAAETFPLAKTTPGHASTRPIFVVGMPRTGTTLIERILTSHSTVASAGELGLIAQLSAEYTQKVVAPPVSDIALMRAHGAIDVAQLGEEYVTAAGLRVDDRPRFVDKMPINSLYAGLIQAALPNARIVCLRRHPVDACMSNFRQIFNADAAHYWYTLTLESTARYYAAFDRLMAHWRATLPPDRFMEVAYEDVVDDVEGQVRRLLSFCDLPFEEGCLRFHENTQAVATASSVQVRSPIYRSSVGRWKRYGDAIAPLLDTLKAVGIRWSE